MNVLLIILYPTGTVYLFGKVWIEAAKAYVRWLLFICILFFSLTKYHLVDSQPLIKNFPIYILAVQWQSRTLRDKYLFSQEKRWENGCINIAAVVEFFLHVFSNIICSCSNSFSLFFFTLYHLEAWSWWFWNWWACWVYWCLPGKKKNDLILIIVILIAVFHRQI